MSNFKIGEKVVCIEPIDNLVKGQIYTIERFRELNGLLGIHVKELEPKMNEMGGWTYYNIERFRKLDHDFAENLLKEISEAMKSETILK